MTEFGFRKKLRYEKARQLSFIEFSSRYWLNLNKWLKMAQAAESYEAVCSFQWELCVYLKPKSFTGLDEMAVEADLLALICAGVYSYVNRRQRHNKEATDNRSDSQSSGRPEIYCSICGKEH